MNNDIYSPPSSDLGRSQPKHFHVITICISILLALYGGIFGISKLYHFFGDTRFFTSVPAYKQLSLTYYLLMHQMETLGLVLACYFLFKCNATKCFKIYIMCAITAFLQEVWISSGAFGLPFNPIKLCPVPIYILMAAYFFFVRKYYVQPKTSTKFKHIHIDQVNVLNERKGNSNSFY